MQAALHLLKAVDGDNRKLVPLPVDNSKKKKVLLVSSIANIIYSGFFTFNMLICCSYHFNFFIYDVPFPRTTFSKLRLACC